MATSKWERYVKIGAILGVVAILVSLLGDQFTNLAIFLGIIASIFIIVGVLIITKFLKKTPLFD